MENGWVIKTLRAELGLTQVELANNLHMSYSSINRWENGKSRPNKSAWKALFDYGKKRGVSNRTLDLIDKEYSKSRRRTSKLGETSEGANIELICALAEASETAVYVADFETDELLFINNKANKILKLDGNIPAGIKCYSHIMRRDAPCAFCHKALMDYKKTLDKALTFPFDGKKYIIRSKLIVWDGRKAHAHFITDINDFMNEQRMLQTLTDNVPAGVGIFYLYDDGRIEEVYLNEGYYKMIGSSRDERRDYVGFATFDSIHKDDVDSLKNKLNIGLEKNQQVRHDVRVMKNDESYMWIRIDAKIVDKSDKMSIVYCVLSDIDDLKN